MADAIKLVSLENLQYFGGKVKTELGKKVDKVEGYGLSKNDFTDALATKLDGIETGAQVNTVTGVKGSAETTYRTGEISISAENIGLGNVENKSSETIRSEITSANVTTALGYTPADSAKVGAASGIASLDENGKVPTAQIPGMVADVIEVANYAALPTTGESAKIYVTLDTNLTYRWGGTAYVEISASLALGETSATAFRGDYGKAAYDHSLVTTGNPHGVTKAEVGLGNVENKDSATIRGEITKENVTTALGFTPVDAADFTVATSEKNGLMSKEDKAKMDSFEIPTKAEMEAAIDAIFA